MCEGIRDLCRVYKVPVPEGCGVNVTLDGGGGGKVKGKGMEFLGGEDG